MGGGMVFTVNTMYWGEIASPGFRGSASSLTQAMLFLGILVADVIAYLAPGDYMTLALCGAAVTVVFVVCFAPMPESPYFLLMRGRPDLAKRALQRLRGKEDVSDYSQQSRAGACAYRQVAGADSGQRKVPVEGSVTLSISFFLQ